MLFNSHFFILIFLPIVLFIFYRIGGRGHHRIAVSWLVGASLFFYGWWNPAYLGLILVSVLFNYAIGVALGNLHFSSVREDNCPKIKQRLKLLLVFGIVLNLGFLGYFKYTNFLFDNVNFLTNNNFNIEKIVLPLAISFFTFQQIAFLMDAYRGETKEYNFLHYCLFVTFFPQLIAGPIVHHKEMLPQFGKASLYRFNYENLLVGITIFSIGLFKKIILADGIAVYSTRVFMASEAGIELTMFEALGGVMSYTFQLYFDFSGYSDMAIGIARMFGVRLPLNFNSPYKANNIIEFWKCWHITLSRFLRDYLYFSLGGNRKGKFRRHINLMLTMLLGGIWHGAGWNFIIWGGLHGLYLVINHLWRYLFNDFYVQNRLLLIMAGFMSRLTTFAAVMIAWVFFRAPSFSGATRILEAMFSFNNIVMPEGFKNRFNNIFGFGDILSGWGVRFEVMPYFFGTDEAVFLMLLLVIVWFAPNTQQFMIRFRPVLQTYQEEVKQWRFPIFQFNINIIWTLSVGIVSIFTLFSLMRVSEFLYFQF
ncbi:MAG: MBOAT family protein [Deltaproteobacteria bacterium]|nr:MBOAT family protein [Deltaproteobacteria bacterium]